MQIVVDRITLLDLVHDRWFDLLDNRFDQDRHEYRLTFDDRRRGPYNEKLLTVTEVADVAIRDEARIQIYDINEIQIEPDRVRIVSAFPLEIVLSVGPQANIFVSDLRGLEQRA